MNIALLGFGVVGKGVYDIISTDFLDWNIKYILEKDQEKLGDLRNKMTDTIEEILDDEEIDVVIELIGGKTVAYEMIKKSLKAGKHVVTANKAVISAYYEELTKLAKQNDVSLLYEASVGGAIIVLDPLFKISQINKVKKIEGIINGSTNFVLSSIFLEDKSLDQALNEAEKLGYIETGSTDDMDGYDLLRKINILSMISYNTYIQENDITRVPLSSLSSEFIDQVKKYNLVVKYIATSNIDSNEVSIHLEPVLVKKDNFWNQINYEDNVISISGEYHLKQSFIGQGAGRYPTASAVVNDLLIIDNKEQRVHKFKSKVTIKNEEMFTFLAQINDEFMVINDITIDEMNRRKDVVCFARVKGGAL